MRYFIEIKLYSTQNKAQKALSEFAAQFNFIVLDSAVELDTFINYIIGEIKNLNKEHKRCKDLKLHKITGWQALTNKTQYSTDHVFDLFVTEINEKRFKEFHSKDTTYKRVYYLIRQAQEAGFRVEKDNKSRIVWVPQKQLARVNENWALRELQFVYNYGIQAEIKM